MNKKVIELYFELHSKGKTHDFKLLKNSRTRFHQLLKVIADKGYQGIPNIHNLSPMPIKKYKNKKLSKEQKKSNRFNQQKLKQNNQ